jgi:hypothetical protein
MGTPFLYLMALVLVLSGNGEVFLLFWVGEGVGVGMLAGGCLTYTVFFEFFYLESMRIYSTFHSTVCLLFQNRIKTSIFLLTYVTLAFRIQ